jgi:tryptophan-rich sensory protein
LFGVQLALNALWSWLFFAWHRGGLALADIVLLWLAIVATAVAFWRLRPLAGALLLPYLLWVGFATALNFAVWRLNPQLLG